MHEVAELPELPAQKDETQERRDQQPQLALFHVAALDRREREHHRETRHEQVERAERRERDIQNLVRIRPDEASSLVNQIRRHQRAEEQAFRADECPEGHLAAVEPHARVVAVRCVCHLHLEGLVRPAIDPSHHDGRAHEHDGDQVCQRADRHDRQPERGDQRPPRAPRNVDGHRRPLRQRGHRCMPFGLPQRHAALAVKL